MVPISILELVNRLAVTLGALVVYRLGTRLPLPGIDPSVLADLYRGGGLLAVERISVFSLGVTPIISTLLLVEVIRLASSHFNNWAGATPANAQRLDHYVLIGSLLVAAVQGYGIASTLEEMRNVVGEPGPQFRLMAVTTFVAATALLVWLAAMISRHGLGSGVWVLFLTPYFAGPGGAILPVYEAMRSGSLTDTGLYATLAYLLIAVAIIVALGQTLAVSGLPLDRTLIWPLFIAAFAVSSLRTAPWLFPIGFTRDAAAALLNPGAPFLLAVQAVIVIVISLAQWQRLLVPPTVVGASVLPINVTALALAALTVVPVLLTTRLGMPVMIHAHLITATVAVALAAQGLLRGSRA